MTADERRRERFGARKGHGPAAYVEARLESTPSSPTAGVRPDGERPVVGRGESEATPQGREVLLAPEADLRAERLAREARRRGEAVALVEGDWIDTWFMTFSGSERLDRRRASGSLDSDTSASPGICVLHLAATPCRMYVGGYSGYWSSFQGERYVRL
jgi:hypothetical protein